MNQEFEDHLRPDERRAFEALPREASPPPLLEQRIVETLKRSNLIRSPKSAPWLGPFRISIAAAASLVLFALGVLAGARWMSAPSPNADSPQFLLLLRPSPSQPQVTAPAEVRRLVEEYTAWAGTVRQAGALVAAEKLKDEARTLRVIDGRLSVLGGPPDQPENTVEGYFVIQAEDYEHALKIAEGCPHLKYGGRIEVRPIDR
jgi:hypothetical protein